VDTQTLSKSNIINMLQSGIVNVKFTKVDGTERVMKCTLAEGIAIPYEKTTDKEKKANTNIISVWDVEKESWRSFRYDSIIDIYK
jgi:WYL_2, Sm-like SH3 beta-barrel fold